MAAANPPRDSSDTGFLRAQAHARAASSGGHGPVRPPAQARGRPRQGPGRQLAHRRSARDRVFVFFGGEPRSTAHPRRCNPEWAHAIAYEWHQYTYAKDEPSGSEADAIAHLGVDHGLDLDLFAVVVEKGLGTIIDSKKVLELAEPAAMRAISSTDRELATGIAFAVRFGVFFGGARPPIASTRSRSAARRAAGARRASAWARGS